MFIQQRSLSEAETPQRPSTANATFLRNFVYKNKLNLKTITMLGYMYILECSNGKYYTGSTNDLEKRLDEHWNGEGANFTKKHPPVKLLYIETFQRIDEAFNREKQVQGWSRAKKECLINNQPEDLKKFSECMNESHFKNYVKQWNMAVVSAWFDYAHQPPLNHRFVMMPLTPLNHRFVMMLLNTLNYKSNAVVQHLLCSFSSGR